MDYAVDTNVLINADGGKTAEADKSCRKKCLLFLKSIVDSGSKDRVLLDIQVPAKKQAKSLIIDEYISSCKSNGVSGFAEVFVKSCLDGFCVAGSNVVTIDLDAVNHQNWFNANAQLPSTFDPDDKKFVAVARKGNGTIANSTDSGYAAHKSDLGCGLKELCPEYFRAKLPEYKKKRGMP